MSNSNDIHDYSNLMFRKFHKMLEYNEEEGREDKRDGNKS